MSEVLDALEKKKSRKFFSILSGLCALIMAGLWVYLMSNFSILPPTISAHESNLAPPLVAVRATHLVCLAGVFFAILSFTREEPSSWYKWVGGVLNLLFFLLIFGLILFAWSVEWG